jgi:hypothetical protein
MLLIKLRLLGSGSLQRAKKSDGGISWKAHEGLRGLQPCIQADKADDCIA